MRKFLLILLVLIWASPPSRAAIGTVTQNNPANASLNVQDTSQCSGTSPSGSYLIQQLPLNAATAVVSLSGTFSGTVTVYLSANSGTTWASAGTVTSTTPLSVTVAGYVHICADVTTYSSGIIGTTISSSLGITSGSSSSGATIVTSNPACTVAGAISYNTSTGLPLVCPAGSGNPVQGEGQTFGYDSALAGVIPNQGKICFDATLTTSSSIITSAGRCNWSSADIGTLVFATSLCSSGQCGFVNYPTSVTIFPSTQLTVARIASVQSSTQITTDCNAPANCASATPSALGAAGHVTVLWGATSTVGQTVAINQAMTNALNANNGCPDIEYPAGIIFFADRLWTAGTIPANNPCTSANNNIFNISQTGYDNFGPAIHGKGFGATMFVPLPTYNWAGCGSGAIGGIDGLDMRDFSVVGFGQSLFLSGLGSSCTTLVSLDSGHVTNVHFEGWANSTNAGGDGVNFGGGVGYNIASDSSVVAFGAGGNSAQSTCHTTGDNDQLSQVICIAAGGFTSFRNDATLVETSNMTFGPPSRTNSPSIVNNGIWQDVNSRCEGAGVSYGQTVGTSIISNLVGASAFLTNFTNGCSQGALASSVGITNAGTIDMDQYKTYLGVAYTTGVNNSGTFLDRGPNNYSGPFTNTGSYISIGGGLANAVPVTAAKLVLSAGWGASAANTALSGADAPIQFTITNTGAGQAASPTITYTFPTAYPAAPFSCSATQTGGNNPSLNPFTASSLTNTGVVFTATGTPTVNDTEIMQITCVTP